MWWMVLGLAGFFALMVAVTVYAWRGIDGKLARVDERLEQIIERGDDDVR